MDQAAAKQQIVEKIKKANNILVTVSNDPSVDQLAACIGITLFLNKLEKHATAVFSGQVPSTLEFLQPERTIESTTDSLRDFIISLDKSKADKLRYKVEDQFVRIYITPYKTSISEKDLVFSEGDFNVEVILALGVRDKAQLDQAITTHGRILHDATVISVNSGPDKAPAIGQINWQDASASSLCEMLVSISEAFGTGLIDSQMATAFLTGIVAETERFSNKVTSPKVMTMAAQLMASGANQQLIVSKLEPPAPPEETAKPVEPAPKPPKSSPSDTLDIPHEADEKSPTPANPSEIRIDEEGNIVSQQAKSAEAVPPSKSAKSASSKEEPKVPIKTQAALPPTPAPLSKTEATAPSSKSVAERHQLIDPSAHPSFGGSFTADTEPNWFDMESSEPVNPLREAATQSAAAGLLDHPKPASPAPMPAPVKEEPAAPKPAESVVSVSAIPKSDMPSVPTLPMPTVDTARTAVTAAVAAEPYDPANEGPVAGLNAQPLSNDLHTPTAGLGAPMPTLVVHPSEDTSDEEMDKPAPPPVPPPLHMNQGLALPMAAPAGSPTQRSK